MQFYRGQFVQFAGLLADAVKTTFARLLIFLSNFTFFCSFVGGILRITWSWSQMKVAKLDQVMSANLLLMV